MIPLILGPALIAGGLWLKSQQTRQAELQTQQMQIAAEHPQLIDQRTGAPALPAIGGMDALLPAAVAISAVSLVLIVRS